MKKQKGAFTLPGESGYEELTLQLAEKWGADIIRDSDGTVLSDDILNAGYGIYSTICIIREHNEWLREHPDQYQQSFLMSEPQTAKDSNLSISLLKGYFTEQFRINDSADSLKYWEVYDRTSGEKVSGDKWNYQSGDGTVQLSGITPFHVYTVNFLAYRIWEEISMYNHVTNHWDKEHLAPIDPVSESAQGYLTQWLENWCKDHPMTNVVRFTSMFYNFVWIWGDRETNRNRFSDWGSYDFTVSPAMLDAFAKEYGYALTSEDFINGGKLHVTHMPANKKQLDYMAFIQRFVSSFGRKLVDIAHHYNKKAYVFYDDSWIGVEPYGPNFKDFGFDGLIKCVFSGYEARLCAGVDVPVHELRLHPYLFPVGLGGAPTFSEGGNPTKDALDYWISVRRALLREKIDRLGLGGYLHLTEGYPDFIECIANLLDDFREIKELHENDEVYTMPVRIAVLHSWGRLRSWSLSGHFHETYMHPLIHINEALSGFPVDVKFINFDDVKNGALADYDLVINAGRAYTAWSGGEYWNDAEVISTLQKWVYEGGVLLGVDEPSAVRSGDHYFKMAYVLGVDLDTGERVCHGKPPVIIDQDLRRRLIPENSSINIKKDIYLLNEEAKVAYGTEGHPSVVLNPYGKGYGVYLPDFTKSAENNRLLLNLILYSTGRTDLMQELPDNIFVEYAYFKKSGKLIAVNNSDRAQTTTIRLPEQDLTLTLEAYETKFVTL